ncbi:hypothetical protein Taro_053473 [Colocasia esculenta]|uniref:Secreted protein n=1 Tax=Colocasia esculenta TaxID=4460 RepID=A0A843XMQ0_COLES|nr:hypothetical protein [Colocasia esculenta]
MLCPFLVAVALPSRLRCIAWLPCVLVRFPRTVFCCPGESFSQDYFVLVSAISVLPQGLRYAASVGLAGAFWRVFPERCLCGSGGGSPRTDLCCFCSSACCSVLSDGLCSLVVGVVHSGEGSSQDRPLSLLAEVLPRSALCSFWATVVLPLWFKVRRSVGLHFGEVLPGWLLVLFSEGVSIRPVVLSQHPWGARSCRGPWTRHVKVVNAMGRSVALRRGGGPCVMSWRRRPCVEHGGGGQPT